MLYTLNFFLQTFLFKCVLNNFNFPHDIDGLIVLPDLVTPKCSSLATPAVLIKPDLPEEPFRVVSSSWRFILSTIFMKHMDSAYHTPLQS